MKEYNEGLKAFNELGYLAKNPYPYRTNRINHRNWKLGFQQSEINHIHATSELANDDNI